MERPRSGGDWTVWVAIYVASVLFGSVILLGGGPNIFSDWSWWQRILLVLIAGPFAALAALLAQMLLEGGLTVAWLGLKSNPLLTIVVIGVIAIGGSLIYQVAK